MAKTALDSNIGADSGAIQGNSLSDGLRLHQHVGQPGGSLTVQPAGPSTDSLSAVQSGSRSGKPARESVTKDSQRSAGPPVRQG